MRFGLAVSIVGHAAILGFGFLAFPEARPFAATDIVALPVDLVPLSELTDLAKGDEQAEIAPEEKPQPKPVVEAPAPSPEPAEKPAEKPIETARQPVAPPPPPPEPEAEPEPEPEPEQVAALPEPEPEPEPPPEEPEPLPEAEPDPEQPAAAPVEPRVPRARPNPPKQVATPKPAPEEAEKLRELAEQPEPEKDFDPEDIAALLNKQDPAGGGDPIPAPEPQTIGSIGGEENAAMTQSELAALQARLYQCWNPPVGVREAGALIVTVRISLLQDGSLAHPPQLLSIGSVSDPLAQIAAESAIRAVVQCAPFGDILRPEKYALWSQIDFVFDPRLMFGG